MVPHLQGGETSVSIQHFEGACVCVCAYVVDDEYREEEEIG